LIHTGTYPLSYGIKLLYLLHPFSHITLKGTKQWTKYLNIKNYINGDTIKSDYLDAHHLHDIIVTKNRKLWDMWGIKLKFSSKINEVWNLLINTVHRYFNQICMGHIKVPNNQMLLTCFNVQRSVINLGLKKWLCSIYCFIIVK